MTKKIHTIALMLAQAAICLASPYSESLPADTDGVARLAGQRTSHPAVIAKAPARAAAQITPADNQMWWGYYQDEENLQSFGAIDAGKWGDAGILINGDQKPVEGGTIVGIRFKTYALPYMKGLKIWMTRRLPQSKGEMDVTEEEITDIPDATTEDGWVELMFQTPHELTGEGVYVGYSVMFDDDTIYDARWPFLLTRDGDRPGACVSRPGIFANDFTDWGKEFPGTHYGTFAIQALVEGDFVPTAATVQPFGYAFALPNKAAKMPVTIANAGTEAITSISYTVINDGEEGLEKTVELDKPIKYYGEEGSLDVEIGPFSTPGLSKGFINITKVNGSRNLHGTTRETMSEGDIHTLAKESPRKTVLETFYSITNGWDMRARIGAEKLKEQFGDDIIHVAAHYDRDVMLPETKDYNELLQIVNKWPSTMVNRSKLIDTFWGEGMSGYAADKPVARAIQYPAPASVSIDPVTMDGSGNASVTSHTVFQYDDTDNHYAMAYVLMADGLTSPGWKQSNSYSGSEDPLITEDPDLGWLADEPEYISNLVFDDVVLATRGVNNGVEDSLTGDIVTGKDFSCTVSFDILGNTVAQDMDKIKVMAMLIDTRTGEVANAAIAPVQVSQVPDWAVQTSHEFETVTVEASKDFSVPCEFINVGMEAATDLTYVAKVDGVQQAARTIKVEGLSSRGDKVMADVACEAPATTGYHNVEITLTGVNGQDNASDVNTMAGQIMTVRQFIPRKVVMEEFTGTWCGNCPRGAIAISLLEEMYPDNFIAIAYHDDNAMEIPGTETLMGLIRGYPDAMFDRTILADPYHGPYFGLSGFHSYECVDWALTQAPVGGISLQHADIQEDNISVRSNTIFQYDDDEAHYSVTYVLVADGLKGEGFDWLQINSYANENKEYTAEYNPELLPLTEEDVMMKTEFDHVAIQVDRHVEGHEGSIPSSIREGEVYTHDYVFDITDNRLVQDRSRLKVVALLIDTNNGHIVNADSMNVSETSGVDSVNAKGVREVARYAADGRLISGEQKGVNIIKYSDGTVVKVMVK